MSDLLSLPPAPCPECGNLRAALEQARQQIAQLQAEIRELRSQLQRNSSNSSSPPSLDPPGAPKPVVKASTGRKPGGQPGHPDIIATDCPRTRHGRPAVRAHCLPTARPPCPTTPPPATPNRPGIRSPRFPCSRRSSPSIKGRRAPARAVATPRGLRFPRRSAPMSWGRNWRRSCPISAVATTWASGASRSWSRPSSKCRSPWGWSRRWKAR